MGEKKYLREIIGNHMVDIADVNENIVAISADLFSSCRMNRFLDKYSNRVYNTGIAEQNMIGFAAGLSHEGFIPYAFTMAAFMSMRACEQIRTDVAYGNLNVRCIAIYAGLSGGLSGATHWSIEDCGIMCSIPNMVVLEPSDAIQAKRMLEATVTWTGPIYMRVSVVPSSDIYDDEYLYQIGKASIAYVGDDGAIICSGVIVQYAVEAAKEIYNETGKRIRVVDMHTIKPVDKDEICNAAKTNHILVAQDHNIIGGLGYCVAAVLVEKKLNPDFKILGIKDEFVAMARPSYLYNKFELDTNGLKKNMYELLKI